MTIHVRKLLIFWSGGGLGGNLDIVYLLSLVLAKILVPDL